MPLAGCDTVVNQHSESEGGLSHDALGDFANLCYSESVALESVHQQDGPPGTHTMPRRPEIALLRILAENIRRFRREKGLSQEALADLCSLHRTYIGSVERFERNVTLATLALIARALRVTVPDLISEGGTDKRQEKQSR